MLARQVIDAIICRAGQEKHPKNHVSHSNRDSWQQSDLAVPIYIALNVFLKLSLEVYVTYMKISHLKVNEGNPLEAGISSLLNLLPSTHCPSPEEVLKLGSHGITILI